MPDKPTRINTPQTSQKVSWKFALAYLLGFLLLLVFMYAVPRPRSTRTVSYSDFLAVIDQDHLSQVEITPSELIGTLKPQSDDLQRATELARQMVTRFGLSERLGNMTYGLPSNQQFLRKLAGMEERDYSEQTAEANDEEVRHLIDSLYVRVNDIPEEHRPALERVVDKLMDKETLNETKLKKLLEPEPMPDKTAAAPA